MLKTVKNDEDETSLAEHPNAIVVADDKHVVSE